MSDFIHLHTHSHYSLLNAVSKIPELVARAKEYEMPALALTDSGNLYGALEFYKACQKENIKPIIGLDAYVATRTRHDKQAGVDDRRFRLVLLAQDHAGYKNLLKIVTASFLEGFYYKPRIDEELMEKYAQGLICIQPSFSGSVVSALKQNDRTEAEQRLNRHLEIYGPENVYLEITHHPEIPGHEDNMEKIKQLAQDTGVPLVAAHDVYYINPDDHMVREALSAIQTNRILDTQTGLEGEEDFSFIAPEQAEKLFKNEPESLKNTKKIADRCNLELQLGEWVFPDLDTGSDRSYDDQLRDLAYQGFERRGMEKTEQTVERLEYELKIIRDKGYSAYFLIVADLLEFAHQRGILTTIRGSVAGSLVTYLAGITNLDPLEYELRFERFLNPDRPSAPDIDMDFADTRRDEVLEYAREKYGRNKVAQIGTFGTMMARGSVRDIARVLGYSYNVGDRIAKQIPMGAQGMPVTIDGALQEVPELKEMYDKEGDAREILDLARRIEGCARHISVHAAGVVISPTDLTDYVPLQYDSKGEEKIITQYDMHAVEDAGLIKFDFLGLKNLTILSNAIKGVEKYHGDKVDIENIPVDDPTTFEMLARGETVGLFQLNGAGMTRYLMELKPTNIHDINAMVALYRPGPMEFIPEYIKRKHNPQLVDYPHPTLEDILKKSHGLLIYQEDVMMTAIKLAGYSWLEADKFRKAMGKKIPELMEEQEKRFKEGCVENEIPQKTADDLWERIKPFALYAFNKSHSASYGRVAYQTAYMKANYPAVYMAAVLTSDSGETEKIAVTIEECRRMKIPVLPPDINKSLGGFTVVKNEETGEDEIRFGLYTIKNFGEGIADTLIAERKENGPYYSLTDLLTRVRDRNLNRKSLEALIKCGAMDSLGERGRMLSNIENMLEFQKELAKAPQDQNSLFDGLGDRGVKAELRLSESEPASGDNMLQWEKELLGLYLSGHPLDKHREKLQRHDNSIDKVKQAANEGVSTVIAGIIQALRPVITKKGDRMAFVTLADYSDTLDVVVFPETYQKHIDLLQPETCIAIKGKISYRNGQCSLIAEIVKKL